MSIEAVIVVAIVCLVIGGPVMKVIGSALKRLVDKND